MVKKTTSEVGGLVPGQKAIVASLVSYQTGSVVSRTIIHDKAGTVTLFAFDEGRASVSTQHLTTLCFIFLRVKPK